MAGHSKWHSIRHKKGAADKARGKVFTRHAKLIEIAARSGGDPDMNPGLRTAIDNAKAANVPNTNIERAIKKGSGELKDGKIIEEVMYEGYGPGGIAILIPCLTDNRNRSITNVKTIMNKNGGNLGESGCVSYMFQRKGQVEVNIEGKSVEDSEMAAIEAGAEDVEIIEKTMIITTAPDECNNVKEAMVGAGFTVKETKLTMIPDTTIEINDVAIAKKIVNLIDKLDEDEDVNEVISNFEISDSVMEQIEE